ncbi:hypothetical protein BGZ63DRAFT_399638 [Mariannaea sp. PMI_226]|nr:hypothetical protein BGZ63DRAFT_399638 [Mariannaea sp. PMI_226]
MAFLTDPLTMTTTSSYPTALTALTTIFTPPDFCTPYVDASSWLVSLEESGLSSCFPGHPSVAGLIHSVYYSPAICPFGYTVDCLRFNSNQGPPLQSGETAAICCPSSFHCAPYDPLDCISTRTGPNSTREDAVYVQIRWKESDLSLFETPPLKPGALTSRRHSGWDPDSSLLSVYTFPPDCSLSTSTWLEGSETTCNPLTGNYYSPAICPDGWTAAYTRPLDGNGPPEEPDETAMYCCPSGLKSISGDGCGEGACISTALVRVKSSYSIKLLMSRRAVQIRWASSDLSKLQTHPLTPGMTLATHFPSSNYSVLPTLYDRDQVRISLAFIPLILAILGVAGATMVLKLRQRSPPSAFQDQFFRPWILKRRIMILLIGFMLSAIVLVELSCHMLPEPNDVQYVTLSSRSLTKVVISEVTIERTQLSSRSKYDVSCDIEGDYTVSRLTTQNHGKTIISPVTVAATSLGAEIYTVCRVLGERVELPTCREPPTAPPPEDFLNDTSPAVKRGYVVGTIVPPLVSSVFGIPWKILAIHASSLEPFRSLARPRGSHMSSFLRQYDGFGALLAPLPAICWIMTYTTAILAPLAAEGWNIKLEGTCDESRSEGCAPVVIVSPVVVRVIEAFLALNIILAIGILIILSFWSTKLRADPRSILGIASLSHSTQFLDLFQSYPKTASWWKFWKTEERQFSQVTLHYGYSRADENELQDFGILVDGAVQKPTQLVHRLPEVRRQTSRHVPVKTVVTLSLFTLGLIAFEVIMIYYRLTPDNQALGRFLSNQSFGPRFLFSIIGVVINFFWVAIFKKYLLFASFLELAGGPSKYSKTIALPYASDSYTHFFSSFATQRILAIAISFSTVLSDFLPLTLANVPFGRTTTWDAYVISTWVSVGLVGFMIAILLAMIGMILFRPSNGYIATKRVQKNPITFILYTLSHSSGLMVWLHSLSLLSASERNERVGRLKLLYELVEIGHQGQDWENSFKPRIEVVGGDVRSGDDKQG